MHSDRWQGQRQRSAPDVAVAISQWLILALLLLCGVCSDEEDDVGDGVNDDEWD